uniref:Bridging integrator 3 n=1 Tax=Oncorhynchus kisutch TaxID=8019 RepID=A0A8C7GI29_ONCKI
ATPCLGQIVKPVQQLITQIVCWHGDVSPFRHIYLVMAFKKFKKSFPSLLSLLRLTMSKAAVKISGDLLSNPLCVQDQAFLESMTALDTAMRGWTPSIRRRSGTVNQISKTVIDPLKKYSSLFPSLNMAVKRREQALQDYKRLQSKVKEYEEKEKTGPTMVKLHQAREELRPVREDKPLLDEMPKFYHSRIDYFQPSFEALIRAQVVYFTEMHNFFSELTDQIDQAGLSDEQRERENEAKLSELRALSFVADD